MSTGSDALRRMSVFLLLFRCYLLFVVLALPPLFVCSQSEGGFASGRNGCTENIANRIECESQPRVTLVTKNLCFPQCTDNNENSVKREDENKIKTTFQIGDKQIKHSHYNKFILRCVSNQPVVWSYNTNLAKQDEKSGFPQPPQHLLTINKTVEGGTKELDCYVSDLCAHASLLTSEREQGGFYLCSPAESQEDTVARHGVTVSARSKTTEENLVNRKRDDLFQITYFQTGELVNSTFDDGQQFKCNASGDIPHNQLHVRIVECLTLEECDQYAKVIEEGEQIVDAVNANATTISKIQYGLAICETKDDTKYNYWPFLQLQEEMVTFNPFSPEAGLESLIALDVHAVDNTRLYIGDAVNVDCYITAYNFSGIPELSVEYPNRNSTPAKLIASEVIRHGAVIRLEAKINVTDQDINALTCKARSKENSKVWASTSCDVVVKEGIRPTITKFPAETITYFNTDTNVGITCEAEGEPCPEINWYKEGSLYKDNLQFSFTYTNFCAGDNKVVSTITFKQVDSGRGSNAEGTYICNATNIRGIALKKVKVHLTFGPVKYAFYGLAVLMSVFIAIMTYLNIKSRQTIRKQQEQIQKLKQEQINEFERGAAVGPGIDEINEDKGNAHIRFKHVDPDFKLSEDSIILKDPMFILGSGNFGQVLLGEDMRHGREGTEVAVKQLINLAWDSPAAYDFLGEIKILTHLHQNFHKHQEHVVQLVGYIADFENDKVQLVMELCSGGNLEKYLSSKRPNFCGYRNNNTAVSAGTPGYIMIGNAFLTIKDLLSYAYQISCGMEVLESERIIHGDLAIRNILLKDMSRRTVKIADFGLARTLGDPHYENSKPFRSLAIECWPTGSALTLKSDVWSFGVLLWEIFTLGGIPYQEICRTDDQAYKIFNFLQHPTHRLERPHHAPNEIYEIMRQCWQANPSSRPDFKSISTVIKEVLDNFDDSFNEPQIQQLSSPGYITEDQLQQLSV